MNVDKNYKKEVLRAPRTIHYIIYICASFGEVLLSISWIRVPRPEPRRFRRVMALHRPLLWRRFLPLFERFYRQLRLNHIHENSSELFVVYASLHASSIISVQSLSITFLLWFLLLFRKVHLFGDQIATHSLMLPYLPRMFHSRFYFLVTLVYVFCVLHAYSCPVLSSYMLWFASLPSCHRFEIVRRQHTNKSFW